MWHEIQQQFLVDIKRQDAQDITSSRRQMANGTNVSVPSSKYQWTLLLADCYDTKL
jgi:hypothetical protein